MSNDSWFGIEPPKDAEGKVIPLDTETLYSTNGQVFHVDQFRYFAKVNRWAAYGAYEHMSGLWTDDTFCFLLTPPDSWEKLEEDMNLGCRDYCEIHRLEECDYNMRVHILARAKKLAGIEEEQR